MDENTRDTGYSLSKVFAATPERLFGSFLEETTLKQIWGVSSITIDARPEGKAHAKLQFGDENWDFTITYKEVSPNEKLRWIVHFDRYPTKEIRVTLQFKTIANGTELTVSQENFESVEERDANKQAWENALVTLDGLLRQ